MSNTFKNWRLLDRLELMDLEQARKFGFEWPHIPLGPYIAGVEVTQSIQYYKASRHLTDPADRGPDNSLKLAALKPGWVRVYVRSGFFASSEVTLTGKLVVERKRSVLPISWDNVGDFNPQFPGTVVAQQSPDYATERGSIASTLNFILPANQVRGVLRVRAIIWPEGGSEASPSDSEEITVNATLRQTLRVRGILVSYNGPNASGTVANMNLPAPTVADLQTTSGNTLTVYPVESTGVFSSGGTIPWSTPLTGVALSPGGCSQQWLDLNVAIAQARANDGNRSDVLYVGLLPSTVPIANVGGCNSSGVSGVPNNQQWTMAHELGHAAGLAHGPCGTPGDPDYPAYEPYDPANSPTASLGEYGLDINDGTIHPPSQKDFMSYCSPVWISLYHYGKLFDNTALDPEWIDVPWRPRIPELYDPWLWPWEYIPDPPGPWELPAHFVRVTVQPVITILGTVSLTGEVNVASVMRIKAVPKLQGAIATNLVAELLRADGQVVSRAPVMRTHAHGMNCGCGGGDHGHEASNTGYAFQAMLSDPEPGSVLRIVKIDSDFEEGPKEMWSRKAIGQPPHLEAVSVRINKREGTIRWEAATSTDQTLEFSIQFSKDKGKSWNGLVAKAAEPRHRFSLADMPSGSVIFRVLAHDGFFTTHADSRPIKLPPRPPIVSILHPYEGRVYQAGMPLRLIAVVNTHVGALNPKLSLKWQVDGRSVGEGLECWIDAPRRGRHKCRVIATDDGGESDAVTTFVTHSISSRSKET